jgi:DNA-binding MarR family transcriptional regulator
MMHMHDVIPSQCACTALRKATRALTRFYDAGLARHGLNTSQFALLRHIARAGEIALSRLAEQLVMDRTTLYRALGPVEAEGWIETVSASKGKTRLVRLTPLGTKIMTQAGDDWQACKNDVRHQLGDQVWTALHATSAAVQALQARGSR